MEQTVKTTKTKTKTLSPVRKLTAELDTELKKLEANKTRLVKIEKEIADGNIKVKALSAQFSKHLT